MFDMLFNLLAGIFAPGAGILSFFALAFLLLGFAVGISVLIGVIRSGDANLVRRFRGVFWAARVPTAADDIARVRGGKF